MSALDQSPASPRAHAPESCGDPARIVAEALQWVTDEFGSFGVDDDWGFEYRGAGDGRPVEVIASHYDDAGEVDATYRLQVTVVGRRWKRPAEVQAEPYGDAGTAEMLETDE